MEGQGLDSNARNGVVGEATSLQTEPATWPIPWYSVSLFWRSRSMVVAGHRHVILVGSDPDTVRHRLASLSCTGHKSGSDAWFWILEQALGRDSG